MSKYKLLIDGNLLDASQYDPVINPATEEIIAYAARASLSQVDQAVEAAHHAFPKWAENETLRKETLLKAASALKARAQEVANLITQEQGRPLHFALGEVAGTIATFEHYANFDLPQPEPLRDDPERFVSIERRPLGVVAAITPWNVPLILLVLKLAPALRAGNTVVAKPSEYTPLSTLLLGDILKDIFPHGVLNIIAGPGEVGERLSLHPLVRKVTFTGSVATGKRLFAGAATDLKRLTLELGGNDAAIVLDDADPEAIAEKIFWGAFWNSGQICFAIKRLYVHEKVFAPLLAALIARAERTKVGNGLEEGIELGPLTNLQQYVRVKELVADAKNNGAQIHTGGEEIKGPGYFYPPTL
ncbi:MAG TPA: aldehyde dehydrogenase family protein, partial [Methyloradius sp.]